MCTMGCAEGIVKLLMFAANVVFALGGLALLIVGVLYKLNLDHYTDALPSDYQPIGVAPTLTIVVGCIIFVIAFFGCCGAIKESPCLLTTYAVILLLIFMLQIAVGIFVFVEIKDKDNLRGSLDKSLDNLFNRFNNNPSNGDKDLVNIIQSELKCCGPDGIWSFSSPTPNTCYPDKDETKSIYTTSCKSAFYNFVLDTMNILGIVVLVLSALEVVGAVFSLCLSSSIKNRERRFRY